MPYRAKKLAVVVAVFALFAAAAAHAEDFNFTVPIRVTRLPPEVTNVLVDCFLYRNEEDARARVGIAVTNFVGNSRVTLRVPDDGNLAVDRVQLRMNVTRAGSFRTEVTHYGCWLTLTGTRIPMGGGDACTVSRPGSTCVDRVVGPIP